MKFNWKKLLLYILIPIGIGALAGFLTRNSMDIYKEINRPAIAPPAWVFPVVWTILYILMGISSYLISISQSAEKGRALFLYKFQLFFNFLWSIVFFTFGEYFASFVVLVIIWYLVYLMIQEFYQINKLAGILQIPYLLWLTFAGILNFLIIVMN